MSIEANYRPTKEETERLYEVIFREYVPMSPTSWMGHQGHIFHGIHTRISMDAGYVISLCIVKCSLENYPKAKILGERIWSKEKEYLRAEVELSQLKSREWFK